MGIKDDPNRHKDDVAPATIDDGHPDAFGSGGLSGDTEPEECWECELSKTTPAVSSIQEGSLVEGIPDNEEVTVCSEKATLGFITGNVAQAILNSLSDGSRLVGQVTKTDGSRCWVNICRYD